MGPGDRQAARQCDRVAGPPHAPLCAELEREGWGAHVAETTGLVIDPYFSATKLAWLLDNVPGLCERAARGEVCFGTIDSFLLFKLTGGALHATDATNAARTMLFDIRTGRGTHALLDAARRAARNAA